MANYYGNTRTNYFHVKDEAAFREFMGKVVGDEDGIELWIRQDAQGNTLFGFGVYGCISGIPVPVLDENGEDTGDTENDYDAFISGLQQHVAEDDAIVIFEAGHQKLCYVGGGALIITAKETYYIDLQTSACKKAAELLQNDKWTTRCEE